jgi:hypothetical protein
MTDLALASSIEPAVKRLRPVSTTHCALVGRRGDRKDADPAQHCAGMGPDPPGGHDVVGQSVF